MHEAANYHRPGSNLRYAHGYAKPPIKKAWQVIFGLTAAAGFCWLAWAAYNAGSQASNPEDVPLIKASDEPFRVRPDEPGGMPIPHRDKQVFEALRGKDDEPHAVKPAPLPEQPQTPEVATAAPVQPAEDIARQREQLLAQKEHPTKNVEELVSPAVVPAEPVKPVVVAKPEPIKPVEPAPMAAAKPEPVVKTEAPKPIAAAPVAPKETATTTVVKEAAPTPAVTARQEAVPAPKAVSGGAATSHTQTKTVAGPFAVTSTFDKVSVVEEKAPAVPRASGGGGNKRAQLAALKSEAEANAMWSRIQGKYPSFTSGKSLHVERADIPGKGVFYRLQVGPFSDSAEVKQFCQSIGQSGCLVK